MLEKGNIPAPFMESLDRIEHERMLDKTFVEPMMLYVPVHIADGIIMSLALAQGVMPLACERCWLIYMAVPAFEGFGAFGE